MYKETSKFLSTRKALVKKKTLTSMNLQAAFGTGYQGAGSILPKVGIGRKGLSVLSTWGKAHLGDQGLGLLSALGKVHERAGLPSRGRDGFFIHLQGLKEKISSDGIASSMVTVSTLNSERSPWKLIMNFKSAPPALPFAPLSLP